jgi:hypothetical protein
MLGVNSEGKILARTLLIFSTKGPRFMYSMNIFDSRGVRLRCSILISWIEKAATTSRPNTTNTPAFINLIIIHTDNNS